MSKHLETRTGRPFDRLDQGQKPAASDVWWRPTLIIARGMELLNCSDLVLNLDQGATRLPLAMHTDQQFDTYPVVQPRFGSEQMSAEMVRRSEEQLAASIALLQSRPPKFSRQERPEE